MTSIRLYHNPKCSKSREALELLRTRGIEPEVVEYLQAPPSRAELQVLVARLGIRPHALLRTAEPEYGALGLSAASADDVVLDALAAHPRLMERPIATFVDRAVIGRPPERVLELLDAVDAVTDRR